MKKIELSPEERWFVWTIEFIAVFCMAGVFYFSFWEPIAPIAGVSGILFGFCQGAAMGISFFTEKRDG